MTNMYSRLNTREEREETPSNIELTGCNVCGQNHNTESCPFLSELQPIQDTETPSRARLTLPANLEVKCLANGTTVIARAHFARGTQFGPFQATQTTVCPPEVTFPLKIFGKSDQDTYYLDTTDEEACNWMCLVAPVTSSCKQNLICYQMNQNIFYTAMCDIKPSEELRVWYAPYYALKMGTMPFSVEITTDEWDKKVKPVLEVPVKLDTPDKPVDSKTNSITEDKQKKKSKNRTKKTSNAIHFKNQKVMQKVAEQLPPQKLGARYAPAKWRCRECWAEEHSVIAYARHLMGHFKPLASILNRPRHCHICKKKFASEKLLVKHKVTKHHVLLQRPRLLANMSEDEGDEPGGGGGGGGGGLESDKEDDPGQQNLNSSCKTPQGGVANRTTSIVIADFTGQLATQNQTEVGDMDQCKGQVCAPEKNVQQLTNALSNNLPLVQTNRWQPAPTDNAISNNPQGNNTTSIMIADLTNQLERLPQTGDKLEQEEDSLMTFVLPPLVQPVSTSVPVLTSGPDISQPSVENVSDDETETVHGPTDHRIAVDMTQLTCQGEEMVCDASGDNMFHAETQSAALNSFLAQLQAESSCPTQSVLKLAFQTEELAEYPCSLPNSLQQEQSIPGYGCLSGSQDHNVHKSLESAQKNTLTYSCITHPQKQHDSMTKPVLQNGNKSASNYPSITNSEERENILKLVFPSEPKKMLGYSSITSAQHNYSMITQLPEDKSIDGGYSVITNTHRPNIPVPLLQSQNKESSGYSGNILQHSQNVLKPVLPSEGMTGYTNILSSQPNQSMMKSTIQDVRKTVTGIVCLSNTTKDESSMQKALFQSEDNLHHNSSIMGQIFQNRIKDDRKNDSTTFVQSQQELVNGHGSELSMADAACNYIVIPMEGTTGGSLSRTSTSLDTGAVFTSLSGENVVEDVRTLLSRGYSLQLLVEQEDGTTTLVDVLTWPEIGGELPSLDVSTMGQSSGNSETFDINTEFDMGENELTIVGNQSSFGQNRADSETVTGFNIGSLEKGSSVGRVVCTDNPSYTTQNNIAFNLNVSSDLSKGKNTVEMIGSQEGMSLIINEAAMGLNKTVAQCEERFSMNESSNNLINVNNMSNNFSASLKEQEKVRLQGLSKVIKQCKKLNLCLDDDQILKDDAISLNFDETDLSSVSTVEECVSEGFSLVDKTNGAFCAGGKGFSMLDEPFDTIQSGEKSFDLLETTQASGGKQFTDSELVQGNKSFSVLELNQTMEKGVGLMEVTKSLKTSSESAQTGNKVLNILEMVVARNDGSKSFKAAQGNEKAFNILEIGTRNDGVKSSVHVREKEFNILEMVEARGAREQEVDTMGEKGFEMPEVETIGSKTISIQESVKIVNNGVLGIQSNAEQLPRNGSFRVEDEGLVSNKSYSVLETSFNILSEDKSLRMEDISQTGGELRVPETMQGVDKMFNVMEFVQSNNKAFDVLENLQKAGKHTGIIESVQTCEGNFNLIKGVQVENRFDTSNVVDSESLVGESQVEVKELVPAVIKTARDRNFGVPESTLSGSDVFGVLDGEQTVKSYGISEEVQSVGDSFGALESSQHGDEGFMNEPGELQFELDGLLLGATDDGSGRCTPRENNVGTHLKEENPTSESSPTVANGGDGEIEMERPLGLRETGPPYNCDICSMEFHKASNLYRHLRKHTGEFICVSCHAVFARKETLLMHSCFLGKGFKGLRCEYCQKKFMSQKSLKRHMGIHTGQFVCQVTGCGRRLRSKASLKIHQYKCNEDRANKAPAFCELCNRDFSNHTVLRRHMALSHRTSKCQYCGMTVKRANSRIQTHESYCEQVTNLNSGNKVAICPDCGVDFTQLVLFRLHVYKHTHSHTCVHCNRKFRFEKDKLGHKCLQKLEQCTLCPKHFTSVTQLERHNICHGVPRFHCFECGRSFHAVDKLQNHSCYDVEIREEDKKKKRKKEEGSQEEKGQEKVQKPKSSICDVCGEIYKNVHSLKAHRLLHGERRFECPVCKKRFHRKDVLQEHLYVHQKPQVPCDVCGKVLKSKKTHEVHMRQHSGKKLYSCDTCGKEFYQKANLIKHARTHIPRPRSLSCPHCAKCFTSQEYLAKHILEHTEEHTYQCELCDKGFIKDHLLKKHIRVYHSGQEFACPFCNIVLKHRNSLQRHIEKVHSELRVQPAPPPVTEPVTTPCTEGAEVLLTVSEVQLTTEGVQQTPPDMLLESAYILEDGTVVRPEDASLGDIVFYVLEPADSTMNGQKELPVL